MVSVDHARESVADVGRDHRHRHVLVFLGAVLRLEFGPHVDGHDRIEDPLQYGNAEREKVREEDPADPEARQLSPVQHPARQRVGEFDFHDSIGRADFRSSRRHMFDHRDRPLRRDHAAGRLLTTRSRHRGSYD